MRNMRKPSGRRMMKSTAKEEPKSCYLCANNVKQVDYKDVILLRRYINTTGKIIPVRRTGTCTSHQRMVSSAVKRARIIGLLPFVAR